MTAEESLVLNFREVLSLPEEAIDFLLKVWKSIQFFDDVADGDEPQRLDFDDVLFDHFIGFATQPFFVAYFTELKPLLSGMILKWQASDEAENRGEVTAKSYMWRAGYYDVVLGVVEICHGHKSAVSLSGAVMNLYGEKFEEYVKEFSNA